MDTVITSYCRISIQGISLKGELTLLPDDVPVQKPDTIYKFKGIEYPKFFKMDKVSKYGFLAAEILFEQNHLLSGYKKEEIGIFLSSRHGSLDTDQQFQHTIRKEEFFPSPALFVYTLPNIVMGELCIRHSIQGENLFTVSEQFDAELLHLYTTALFQGNAITAAVVGWVDYHHETPDVLLLFVERKKENEEGLSFTIPTLQIVYHSL